MFLFVSLVRVNTQWRWLHRVLVKNKGHLKYVHMLIHMMVTKCSFRNHYFLKITTFYWYTIITSRKFHYIKNIKIHKQSKYQAVQVLKSSVIWNCEYKTIWISDNANRRDSFNFFLMIFYLSQYWEKSFIFIVIQWWQVAYIPLLRIWDQTLWCMNTWILQHNPTFIHAQLSMDLKNIPLGYHDHLILLVR